MKYHSFANSCRTILRDTMLEKVCCGFKKKQIRLSTTSTKDMCFCSGLKLKIFPIFSDQMVLINRLEHHKLLKQFLFNEVQILDLQDSIGNIKRVSIYRVGEKHVFAINSLRGEELFRFSLKTIEEKKSWVADITKEINKYRGTF